MPSTPHNCWSHLECVYGHMRGSGKNRRRYERIKWAERGTPRFENLIKGVRLRFRFDVPAGLSKADILQKNDYHLWRLLVAAALPSIDLSRQYNIPVFASGEQSGAIVHDISAKARAAREEVSADVAASIESGDFNIASLNRAVRVEEEGPELILHNPPFRNRFLTVVALI